MSRQTQQLAAVAALSTTAGGTAVDVSEFHGKAQVILIHTATGTPGHTVDFKLQHSEDNSTWADVTGAAFVQVTSVAAGTKVIEVDADKLSRYLRLHRTVSASAVCTAGAVVVGKKQYSAN